MGNVIFATSSAKHLGLDNGRLRIGRYVNAEVSVVLDRNVKGKHIVLIGSTGAPAENLLEMFWSVETIIRNGAERVSLIIPNFGYGKSDKEKIKGQALGARAILNILNELGEGKLDVSTINLHSDKVARLSKLHIRNISAMGILTKPFLNTSGLAFVSPDKGGLQRTQEFADILGFPKSVVIMDKKRSGNTLTGTKIIKGEVKGRDCVIVDDRIESGATMQLSIETLQKAGAGGIYVVSVHIDYLGGGWRKLISNPAVKAVYTTNSTKPIGKHRKIVVLDIAPLLSKTIAINK